MPRGRKIGRHGARNTTSMISTSEKIPNIPKMVLLPAFTPP